MLFNQPNYAVDITVQDALQSPHYVLKVVFVALSDLTHGPFYLSLQRFHLRRPNGGMLRSDKNV